MTKRTHSLPAVNSITAITVVEASNSLADLAARIKTEHEASGLALKRGLGHAIACGRLLIEAKARVPHGHWGPWLREHCGIPERSVQRYMELAAYAADNQSAKLADLAFATGAFTAQDFESDFDWVETKLLHQLPAIAAWCFQVARMTVDGRPALRLCPWNELAEAAGALAPIAVRFVPGKKTTDLNMPLKFDATSFESMRAMRRATNQVEVLAAWMLGGVLSEMENRERITDEQYAKEWDETHQYLMARLDEKLAALEHERAPEGVS